MRRGCRLRDGAAGRGDAFARPGVHAARLRHRHRRRSRLDGRRTARRSPDRRLGGACRAVHRALGQEHVQLWPADSRPAASPSRPAWEAIVKRRVAALAVLAILLLVLPGFAGPYALSVATLILYFAYTGQAWNVMMGFAGQLSLGHALYVGVAGDPPRGPFLPPPIPASLPPPGGVLPCAPFGPPVAPLPVPL